MFHHIIMPDSWFAVIWERLVLAVLLAICFSYTFVASFSISLHAIGYGESIGKQVLLVITYLFDAVLVADFIMRFNMASETTTGNYNYLRTFVRKIPTKQISFILWLQSDNELPMSEMQKNSGVTDFVFEEKRVDTTPILTNRPSPLDIAAVLVS